MPGPTSNRDADTQSRHLHADDRAACGSGRHGSSRWTGLPTTVPRSSGR